MLSYPSTNKTLSTIQIESSKAFFTCWRTILSQPPCAQLEQSLHQLRLFLSGRRPALQLIDRLELAFRSGHVFPVPVCHSTFVVNDIAVSLAF
ncbi:hypothetical protein ALCH109712_06520 [Alkalicoccus chagannorensis]